MTEDKARDRVESGDSGRERNAVIRPQEPAADRMDFFNGLLGREGEKPGGHGERIFLPQSSGGGILTTRLENWWAILDSNQ